MMKSHSSKLISPADLLSSALDDPIDIGNHAPVVDFGWYTTREHSAPLILDILASAHDDDGDPLTLVAATTTLKDFDVFITQDQKIQVTYRGPDVDPSDSDLKVPEVGTYIQYTITDGTATVTGNWFVDMWADWEPGEFISGTRRGDTLAGSWIDQRIYGNGGADTILGKRGNDFIAGGYGDDILRGGAGADTFNFGDFRDRKASHDVIVDFSRAEGDVIDFSIPMPSQQAELHTLRAIKAHSVDIGDDMIIIQDSRHTIEIKGMNTDDLVRSDFVF